MAGFVSDSELDSLRSDLQKTFQTFNDTGNIVVWKEPILIQQNVQQTNNGQFGFNGADVSTEQQYIPVSGVFPATIRYASLKHVGQAAVLQDTNTMVPIGEVKIKVAPDCYAFIESGQTDKISFHGRDFYFAGKAQACSFLGTLYYMYQLKPKI